MANEKRLIYANALMDTVEGINWYHIDKLGYLVNGANSQDHTPIYKAEDIYDAIRNAPTVDAVEVVHGWWIETEEGTICSECHEHPFTDGYFAIANYNGDWCPNCGAKMDGGNEDG